MQKRLVFITVHSVATINSRFLFFFLSQEGTKNAITAAMQCNAQSTNKSLKVSLPFTSADPFHILYYRTNLQEFP